MTDREDFWHGIVSLLLFFVWMGAILFFAPVMGFGADDREQARETRYACASSPDIPGFFWAGNRPMSPERLDSTVRAVLARLPHIPDTDDWRALVIETARAETNGGRFAVAWRSRGDLGIFQIREETARDTIHWLSFRHPDVLRAVMSFYDRKQSLRFNLEFNAPFGAALCATYYWRRDPLADISTPLTRAALWKTEYNTRRGKGSLAAWFAAQR